MVRLIPWYGTYTVQYQECWGWLWVVARVCCEGRFVLLRLLYCAVLSTVLPYFVRWGLDEAQSAVCTPELKSERGNGVSWAPSRKLS